MSLVLKTHLKVSRHLDGRGRIVAHTSSQGPRGDRLLLCTILLGPDDQDIEVDRSEHLHGPGITWSRGERLTSIRLGEGRAGGVLEVDFSMERTVVAEGGAPELHGEGGSRNRAAGVDGDGLQWPAEGHAAETTEGTAGFN